MLQTATVASDTLELLRNLQAEPLLHSTRLVQSQLIDKYGFIPNVIDANTLIGFIQGVKIQIHPLRRHRRRDPLR